MISAARLTFAGSSDAAATVPGVQLSLWAPGITPAHVYRIEPIRAKLYLEGAANDSDTEIMRIFSPCVAADRLIRVAIELRDAGVDLLTTVRERGLVDEGVHGQGKRLHAQNA